MLTASLKKELLDKFDGRQHRRECLPCFVISDILCPTQLTVEDNPLADVNGFLDAVEPQEITAQLSYGFRQCFLYCLGDLLAIGSARDIVFVNTDDIGAAADPTGTTDHLIAQAFMKGCLQDMNMAALLLAIDPCAAGSAGNEEDSNAVFVIVEVMEYIVPFPILGSRIDETDGNLEDLENGVDQQA